MINQSVVLRCCLVLIIGFSLLANFKMQSLKSDLALSNQAYEEQIAKNAKAQTVFNTVLNDNFEDSNAIIQKLKKELEFESKRAHVAKEVAQLALLDRDAIQTKHIENMNRLSELKNEKNNTCVNADMPADYLAWLRALSS